MNPSRALAEFGKAIVESMRRRIRAGVGADGAPMPAYSPLYREQLAALGASMVVDIEGSGRLLADLRVVSVSRNGEVWSVVFGVGTGTSPKTPRPPPWVFSKKQTPAQAAKALERWRASTKKQAQTEPHDRVLERLVTGGVGRPPRKILGLPPAEQARLARILEKLPIFSYG